jgi:hypothetical protein
MKGAIRNSVVLMVVLFSVGCASGPSYDKVASSFQPVASNQGRIFCYRNSAVGAAVQPDIRLNGTVIGKAVPKGFFYVDRPAGTYEISASTEATRNLSINLEPGDEKYVRLEVKLGVFVGHIKPVLVDASKGQAEIKKTKYIAK